MYNLYTFITLYNTIITFIQYIYNLYTFITFIQYIYNLKTLNKEDDFRSNSYKANSFIRH